MAHKRIWTTELYTRADEFTPRPGSVYIHGLSVEERSRHQQAWQSLTSNVEFVTLSEIDTEQFLSSKGETEVRVNLRSSRQLIQWSANFAKQVVYIDITGLSHHVWAGVLRACLDAQADVRVVYVEPSDYKFSQAPTEGEIFDLSEETKGIRPLPGFASLKEVPDESTCFVPLLGFEGQRLAHVIERIQPPGKNIFPVIGVPGFRAEYPFYAYQGNKLPLMTHGAWKNIRLAAANCPFHLFEVLEDIAITTRAQLLKVAPIGTKPHALGALLFAMSRPDLVEIVYDHPIRKAKRTQGSARLLVYHVVGLPGLRR